MGRSPNRARGITSPSSAHSHHIQVEVGAWRRQGGNRGQQSGEQSRRVDAVVYRRLPGVDFTPDDRAAWRLSAADHGLLEERSTTRRRRGTGSNLPHESRCLEQIEVVDRVVFQLG